MFSVFSVFSVCFDVSLSTNFTMAFRDSSPTHASFEMELVRSVVVVVVVSPFARRVSRSRKIKGEQSFHVKITTTPLLPDATAIAMTYPHRGFSVGSPKEIGREREREEEENILT